MTSSFISTFISYIL